MISTCKVAFVYEFEFVDAAGHLVWKEKVENLIPQAGVDYIASVMFGDTSPLGTFYVFPFSANVVPAANMTSADIPGTLSEFTGYSQTSRPIWQRVYDGVGMISNVQARAEFSITTNARLYGGGLVSNSTKGGATGLLLSVARFGSPQDVTANGTFRVAAGISLVPTNTN